MAPLIRQHEVSLDRNAVSERGGPYVGILTRYWATWSTAAGYQAYKFTQRITPQSSTAGYYESLKGKLRDEMLNGERLYVGDAKIVIESWQSLDVTEVSGRNAYPKRITQWGAGQADIAICWLFPNHFQICAGPLLEEMDKGGPTRYRDYRSVVPQHQPKILN